MSSLFASGSSLAKKETPVESTITDNQIGKNIPKGEDKFKIIIDEDLNENFTDLFEPADRTENAKRTDTQSTHAIILDDEQEESLLRQKSWNSNRSIIEKEQLLLRLKSWNSDMATVAPEELLLRQKSWNGNRSAIAEEELLVRQKSWSSNRSAIAEEELLVRQKSWSSDRSIIHTKQDIYPDEVSSGLCSSAADLPSSLESLSDHSKRPELKRRTCFRYGDTDINH